MNRRMKAATLALAMLVTNSAASQQKYDHNGTAQNGWSMEQNRSAKWYLAQQKRVNGALAGLRLQRSGVIDAYVVSIGLNSDPVFAREASEAAHVLSYRYGAVGRTIYLAAGADDKDTGTPQGSPSNLALTLAGIAKKMDRREDVLILFATTHGDPESGLVYNDGKNGIGMIVPKQLASLLDELGFERRIILLSACFAGVFVPKLKSKNSIIVTAASSTRSSFGCEPGNDWTFFGDALVNNALRKNQPFKSAANEAVAQIEGWETKLRLTPSQPQIFIGSETGNWLKSLDAKIPKLETAKVGRSAVTGN